MSEPLEETVRDTPRRVSRATSTVLRVLRSPDRALPADIPLTTVPLAIG